LKRVERIVLKLVVFHFVLLIVSQIAFHHLELFPPLNKLTMYEGVNKRSFTEMIEVMNRQ
jgi:hypothetical protein